VPRRGRAGVRKCRVSVSTGKISISEDPRTHEISDQPRKRKRPNFDAALRPHLEILGLDEIPREIADLLRAFRQRARAVHPDKSAETSDAFLRLVAAKDAVAAWINLNRKS
jgi:hypothetical protein